MNEQPHRTLEPKSVFCVNLTTESPHQFTECVKPNKLRIVVFHDYKLFNVFSHQVDSNCIITKANDGDSFCSRTQPRANFQFKTLICSPGFVLFISPIDAMENILIH